MYIQQYRNGRLFSVRIVEYAIRVIGCYASANPCDRVAVANQPLPMLNGNSILDWLITLIIPGQAGHIISAVTWTLAILCGETHAQDAHELPIQNNAASGNTLLEVLHHKKVISKLHYLMTTCKNALSNNTVPQCFDSQFLEIAFEDVQLLQMTRDPQKGLAQMVRIRTEVISNICCAFCHLIPGFWQNGQYLQSQEGQAFIVNLQWFLGSSLQALKALPPSASNESSADIQMHASHLRVVHHTIACIKRIIVSTTDTSMGLNFNTLPACLLTMLQLRRFPTLNANGASTVGIVVRNNTLLNSVVQHNSFVDTLKGYLDDNDMQTRVTSIFKSIAQHATPTCLDVIKQCHVIKALFNCLSNFRSNDAQVTQALNYQGAETFNIPLATNIIIAADMFLINPGQQGNQTNNQMKPMTSEFGRHEMEALAELFTTIFNEIKGQRNIARWQGNAREEGTAGHLYQKCVQFLVSIYNQFQPLCNVQRYSQQASEVIGISESLKKKFMLLIEGNMQGIMHLMQMDGKKRREKERKEKRPEVFLLWLLSC
jgi:hypothetical protein